MSDIHCDRDPSASCTSTATTTTITTTSVCTNITYTMKDTTTVSLPLTPELDPPVTDVTNALNSSLSSKQQTVLAWLQEELSIYVELRLLSLRDLVCSVASVHGNKGSGSNDHRRLSDTPVTPPPTTTATAADTSVAVVLHLLAHHYFPDHVALSTSEHSTFNAMITSNQKVLEQDYSLFQDQFQITSAISDLHYHHPTFYEYILSIKTSVDKAAEQQSVSDAASTSEVNALFKKLSDLEVKLRQKWIYRGQQKIDQDQACNAFLQVYPQEKKDYDSILQQNRSSRATLAPRISAVDALYHTLYHEKKHSQQGFPNDANAADLYLVKDPSVNGNADIAYLLNELEFIQAKMLKATVTTKESIEELKQNSDRINQAMKQLKEGYLSSPSNVDQDHLQQYAALVQKHHLVSGWVEEVLVWFVEAERISHWIEERIRVVETEMEEQKCIHLVHHAALDMVEFDCTADQINTWNEQHRQLVAEVDRFDEEDMTRLRAHVKQLTNVEQHAIQKDLSPADTTTIEITLTTLTTLDRLMYLLRRQEYELQLLTLRQRWEHTYPTAMEWVEQTLEDTITFINANARWQGKEDKKGTRKQLTIQQLIELEQEIAAFDADAFSTTVEQYQALDDACPIELPQHLETRQVALERKFELVTLLVGFARQLVEQQLAVFDFLDRVDHLTDEGITLQNALRAYIGVDSVDGETQYKPLLMKNKDIVGHFTVQVSSYQEHVIRIITSSTSNIIYPEATTAIFPPLKEEEQLEANDAIRTIVDKQKTSLLEMSDSLQALLIELKNQQLQLQKRAQKWHAEATRLCKWGEERLKLLDKFDKDILEKTIDLQSSLQGLLDGKDLARYKKENDGQRAKLSQIRNEEYQRLMDQISVLAISSEATAPLEEMLGKVEQALQLHEQKLHLLTSWMQWESQFIELNKWISDITLELWQFISQYAQWRPSSNCEIQSVQVACEHFMDRVNTFQANDFKSIQQQFSPLVLLFDDRQKGTCAHIRSRQATLQQGLKNVFDLVSYAQQVVQQHKALLLFTEKADQLDNAGQRLLQEMLEPLHIVVVAESDLLNDFERRVDQFSTDITQLWTEQQQRESQLYLLYPTCEKDTWATRPSTTDDHTSLDVAAAISDFHERLQSLLKQLKLTLQQLTLVMQYRVDVLAWITKTELMIATLKQWRAEISSYSFDMEQQLITYFPCERTGDANQPMLLTVDDCSTQVETVWNQQYLKKAADMLDQEKEAICSIGTLYESIQKDLNDAVHDTLQLQFTTTWHNVHQAYNNLKACIDGKAIDFEYYCLHQHYNEQRDVVVRLLNQVDSEQPHIINSMLTIQPRLFEKETAAFEKLYQRFTELDALCVATVLQPFTQSYEQLSAHLLGKQLQYCFDNREKTQAKTEDVEAEYNHLIDRWGAVRRVIDSGLNTLNQLKQWFDLYRDLFGIEHDIASIISLLAQERNSDEPDPYQKESTKLYALESCLSVIDTSRLDIIIEKADSASSSNRNVAESNNINFSQEYARVRILLEEALSLLEQKEEQARLENDRKACQSLVTDLLQQIEAATATIQCGNQQHRDALRTLQSASIHKSPDMLTHSLEQNYRLATTDLNIKHKKLQQDLHIQAASTLLFKQIENVPAQAAAVEKMKLQLKDALVTLDEVVSVGEAMHQWLRQVISHQKSAKDILTWMEGCIRESNSLKGQQEAEGRKLEIIIGKIDEFTPVMQSFENLADGIISSSCATGELEKIIIESIVQPKTDEVVDRWKAIQTNSDELKTQASAIKMLTILHRLYNETNALIQKVPLPTLAETHTTLQQVNNDLFVMANMPRQAEIEEIRRQLKSVASNLNAKATQLFEKLDVLKAMNEAAEERYQLMKHSIGCLFDTIQSKQTLADNYLSMCPFLSSADEIVLLLSSLGEVIDQTDNPLNPSYAKLIELDKRFEYYEREILQQFNNARRQYRTSSSNTINHNANDMAHQLTEIFLNELELQWEAMKKRCKKRKIELSRLIGSNTLSLGQAAAARSRKTSMPTSRMQHMTSPTLSSSSSTSSLQTTATNSSTHRRQLLKPSQQPSFKSISSSFSNSQHQHNASKSALPARKRLTSATSLAPPTTVVSLSAASPNTRQRKKSSPPPPLPPKRINSYIADPDNDLDMEIGRIINDTPYLIKVKMVPGEVGRYWFGNVNPKLCYCRVLKSKMVMVRVGGGWTELSQFLRDHALLEGDFQPIQHNSTNKKQYHQFPPSSSSSSSYEQHHDMYSQHRDNNPYYEQVFQEGFIETRRQQQRLPSQQSQQSDDPSASISQFLNDASSNKKQVTSKRSFYNKAMQQGYKEGDKFITIDSFGNQHEVQMRRALSPNQHFMKKSHSSTTTSNAIPSNNSNGSGDNNPLFSGSYTEERLMKRKLKKQLQKQQQNNCTSVDDEIEEAVADVSTALNSLTVDAPSVNTDNK